MSERTTITDHPTIPGARIITYSDEMREKLTVGDVDLRARLQEQATHDDRERWMIAVALWAFVVGAVFLGFAMVLSTL